ncbi:CHAT domain-containing protein [Nonomuraea sp. FMUSA5-5]|uniref:CHAT domain-containing protein n=1 Tax=Nonomuraea composti TaxID=2720023 RepID=A0ABX1BJU6_9ACTN|nr:CHAT domain-containing protein [Nonomuraea sp. FMUSA5-5]NJP95388.1 CHAT domain-containing protein [Nonomuraea sp. FMUSA5-5]
MTEPAAALAARIARFEQAADPELIWDPAALSEAEQAMRACAGDRSDAATWRQIGILHLARYRLDPRTARDAAVAGAFFAAVAVLDPGRLPEKLRGSRVPPGDSAGTWAGLLEEVLGHVDPAAYRHVGLLVHALVRRAVTPPDPDVCERLTRLLLQESMRSTDPSWAPGALAPVGNALVRLHTATGERGTALDAVHVLLRAALGDPAHTGDLAAALAAASPGDEDLIRAYLSAAETPPASHERSQALLTLVDLTQTRAATTYADDDLLAFIRAGQCALDFWHEQWAHPGVVAPYASGLIDWYVVTGDDRSLDAATEMLEALHVAPDETTRGLATDPAVRLGLLADRRWHRYLTTGALADLDDAIQALHQATRPTLTLTRDHPPSTTHPARTGSAPDLAGDASAGPPDRASLLTTLAHALLRRAVITGGDPAEPIAAARTALAAHDPEHPGRPGTLLLLARALRLALTPETTDEAVTALREALTSDQPPSFRIEAYGLMSELLCRRASELTHTDQRTEDLRTEDLRTEDLREAVLAARQAVELALKSAPPQTAPAQRKLCEALLTRYAAQHDPRDLTEALTLAGDGDAALLSALDPPPTVDEHLSRAATALALRLPDEQTTLNLLELAERGTENPAESLLEAARRLATSGRPRTAVRVLDRAVRAFESSGSLPRAAFALSTQAAIHEDLATTPASTTPAALDEYQRALSAYERAATLYRSLADTRSEALQLGNMARIHLHTGNPEGAVELYLRAAAQCEAAGLPAEEAAQQVHAAEAYLALNDPQAAVTCASRARELYRAAGDRRAAALALVPAAKAAIDEDDLTAANERMAACAIELEAAGEWEEACRALDQHAVTLATRGHHGHAAACETRLVEIVRRRGRRREPADEWYRIGQRRRTRGDTDGARMAFELAGREYESLGHHDGAASVRYNLGVLAYTEGEPERALEAFAAAAEAFAGLRAPSKEAMALVMGASCLTALDRADDALADLDRASDLAAAEGDLDALFTATLGRAAAHVRLGEPRQARDRLSSALGLAAADPLKQAVTHDRLAALAAREGDVRTQVTALESALTCFRTSGHAHLTALAAIKLGLALESSGELRQARAHLESGLSTLTPPPAPTPITTPPSTPAPAVASDLRRPEAPFEVVAAMADGLDAETLSRLAAIQLTLGDLTHGRATLAQAVTTLRAGGRQAGAALERLELRLRLEQAEASGDLPTARALAEESLAPDPAGPLGQEPEGSRPLEPQSLGSVSGSPQSLAPQPLNPEVGSRQTADPQSLEPSGPDAQERSYLLGKLSRYCRELGDLTAAHHYATRGCELQDERVAEHLGNLGAATTAMGRAEEAAGHLTEAVELARDADSALPAPLVQSLALLGAALTDLGRCEEAARAYEEGLALVEAPVWRALRVPLLSGRADLHLKLGELNEAAARFRKAIALGEELGPRTGLAPAYAGLSLVHELRGEPATAIPLAERALELERANGHGRGTVLALLSLARLGAPQRLEEALALAQHIGFPAAEAIALRHLASLDLPAPATPAPGVTDRTAPDLATPAPATPHPGAPDLALATISYERARRRLTRAIDLLSDLGHDQELATAYHHRSIAEEGLGDLPAALADAERACALGREAARDRAIRLAVRLNLAMTAWAHAEQAKLAALTPEPPAQRPSPAPQRRHRSELADGDMPEHRSGPADRDKPEHRSEPAHGDKPEDLTLAAHVTDLDDLVEAERRALETVRTLLMIARNTPDPDRAASIIRRARAAQTDLEALWHRLEPHAAALVALRRRKPPTRAQLDALVSVPDDRSDDRFDDRAARGARALIGFHLGEGTAPGEGTVTVLAHRTGWPEPRAFPTLVERVLLEEFRRTLHGRRPGLLDIEARRHRADVWRRLADLLLSEVLDVLGNGIELLHLIPHPALRGLPLHALSPSGHLLIERFPVAYAPFATALAHAIHRPARPGVGSLVLGHTTDPAARPAVEAEAREAATLLSGGTTDTAGTIGSTGGAALHLAHEATSARLQGFWDVLHLACPAVYDHADPFASGLRLADGLLTARRLMTMNVTANLALITAQDPAPTPPEASSDGMAALSYALLHAGVRAALLTLWPVSPEITRALVHDLHTRLSAGATPATALRAAVLALRDLYGSAEPDLWASYVPIGLLEGPGRG